MRIKLYTLTIAALLLLALSSNQVSAQTSDSDINSLPKHWPTDLQWQDVFRNGNRRQIGTRASELAISYSGEINSEDGNAFIEFTLNEAHIHETLSRRDIYFANVKALFRLEHQDVVIVTLSNGGTGSSPPGLWLITIDDQGNTEFLKNTALRSGDWTYSFAADDQNIYIDLG